MQRIEFTIGDHAQEIEPVQQVGGAHPAPGEDLSGVDASLQVYADDLGLSLSTVRSDRRPDRPETVPQKLAAIHRLADDDDVAARVTAAVLRRPAVAARVVADDTARHMVNKAQTTSAAHRMPRASSCCPAAGWSSEVGRGSCAPDGTSGTTNASQR